MTIALEQETEVNAVSIGFLQNTDSWIFAPELVEYFVSDDNKSFRTIGVVQRSILEKPTREQRVSYTLTVPVVVARYIRVHAKNIAVCPAWHKGAGNKAWLFADEIIVE